MIEKNKPQVVILCEVFDSKIQKIFKKNFLEKGWICDFPSIPTKKIIDLLKTSSGLFIAWNPTYVSISKLTFIPFENSCGEDYLSNKGIFTGICNPIYTTRTLA